MFCCCAAAPETNSTSIEAVPPAKEQEQKASTPAVMEEKKAEAPPPAAVAAPKAGAKKFEGPGKVSVSLKRDNNEQSWGIVAELVSGANNMLLITEVSSGSPGEAYNKSAAAGAYALEAGDVITKVNGKDEPAAMLKELQESKSAVDFKANRPRTLKHTIKKEGKPLGLVLKHTETGSALYVKEIKDSSLVKTSNIDLKPGDMIMAVNGKSGKALELLDTMKAADVLDVEVARVE